MEKTKPRKKSACAAGRWAELPQLASFFKVFSDSSRVQILFALLGGPLCVQDIANAVAMEQSAVSHQLRVLRDSRLCSTERRGKQLFYALADEHIERILTMGLEHIREIDDPPHAR